MKANELRIGNLTNEGEITLSDFYNMCLDDNCPYTPIPLTEGVLLKFGISIAWLRLDIDGYYVIINRKKVYIKFVHSLQNMYFCIEQKEMIWKNI